MNKKEFEAFLKQRLAVLNVSEQQEIIDEYTQHIDLKVAAGKTEEEAITDFGDLNEFADSILEAYHVNPDYSSNFIVEGAEKVANGISDLANKLEKMNSEKVINLIIGVVLILLAAGLLYWPFRLLITILFGILFFIPRFITTFLLFIFNLGYLIVLILVLYMFVKRKVDVVVGPIAFSGNTRKDMRSQNFTTASKEVTPEYEVNEHFSQASEKEQADNPQAQVIEPKERRRKQGESSSVAKLLIIICKIFLIFMAIPLIFAVFGTIIAFGFLVVFLINGVGSIGIALIVLGIAVFLMTLLSGLGQFIFGGKR